MKPEVLVLDEPTAGLDKAGQESVFELLHRLNQEGITIILITHRMEDVAEHVKRVLVMNDGRIVMDDTPENVFEKYTEIERFGLRVPEVTYIMEGLRAQGFEVPEKVIKRDDAVSYLKRILSLR